MLPASLQIPYKTDACQADPSSPVLVLLVVDELALVGIPADVVYVSEVDG